MRNNFSEFLLSPTGFELHGRQMRLQIRLPWYRALPLSVVEIGCLRLDGVEVPIGDIRITVNGRTVAASALGELTDEVWYVLDDALLEATLPAAPSGPAPHTVELTLKLFPPYIPGLAWVTQSSRAYRAT